MPEIYEKTMAINLSLMSIKTNESDFSSNMGEHNAYGIFGNPFTTICKLLVNL